MTTQAGPFSSQVDLRCCCCYVLSRAYQIWSTFPFKEEANLLVEWGSLCYVFETLWALTVGCGMARFQMKCRAPVGKNTMLQQGVHDEFKTKVPQSMGSFVWGRSAQVQVGLSLQNLVCNLCHTLHFDFSE